MKRLLYIQDSFGNGGINVVESIKENWLFDNGYDVCNLNVLNQHDFDGSFRYRDGVKKYYIENERLDELYAVPVVGTFLRFFYYRVKLIYFILRINPDIIIASRDELEPFTVVLCTFWKKRILEFHCAYLEKDFANCSLKQRLRYKIKYKFYNQVSLTEQDKENRELIFRQKCFCIPNPLCCKPETYSTQEEKRLLIIARLHSQKNIPALISAWNKVEEKHPDWILDIYGEGDEKVSVAEIINEKKLNSVRLKGYVKEPFGIIPNYSLFLFPSLYEGFGMTLIECMSCGVPCVAYDCPCGPSEIITDGEDGIIVPLNDMDTFIDKVNYLIEHPDVRKSMSLKCRESIKRFDLDVVMKQWMKLFDEI